MQLSNDELIHIASFLGDKDFMSFRNCNMRTRELEYYPIRYYVSNVKSIYSVIWTMNKCIFILVSSLTTYIMLIAFIVGISVLTTNTTRDYGQDIAGYVCLISTGVLMVSLILFIMRSFKIKRNRIPIITSTSGEIIV